LVDDLRKKSFIGYCLDKFESFEVVKFLFDLFSGINPINYVVSHLYDVIKDRQLLQIVETKSQLINYVKSVDRRNRY